MYCICCVFIAINFDNQIPTECAVTLRHSHTLTALAIVFLDYGDICISRDHVMLFLTSVCSYTG
jgi:hypothetical protein